MTEDDLFKEVILQDGERLVGVRSKLLAYDSQHNYVHCNMILVIGWLEWAKMCVLNDKPSFLNLGW